MLNYIGEGNGTPLQYFAWKIPWMEELGGLQSMGSLRVGHDWATSLSLFTFMHWRRKWHPTPVFLPGESQGRGSLVAAVCGITQSRTWLKWLSSSSSILEEREFFPLPVSFSRRCQWSTLKDVDFKKHFNVPSFSQDYENILFCRPEIPQGFPFLQ